MYLFKIVTLAHPPAPRKEWLTDTSINL